MDRPLVFLTAVLGLGIAAQWLAWRLKLPSILLLLAFGFLVGFWSGDDPSVPGDTLPDEVITQRLLFPVVSLAVAVIMFEGGLTLKFYELEDSGHGVLRLVTVGALTTWVLSALAAYYLVGMHGYVATLTGAILVVTGPTVIVPLLRHVRPFRRIGSIIKWEGIVIDPIGAVLAVLVFDALIIGHHSTLLMLLKITAFGVLLGVGTALVLVYVMRRYWIPDFLHNPVFLAVATGIFTASNMVATEAGLVTVTIFGVVLANQKSVPVRHVLEFKENLRVLFIGCLFIVLAARIRVEDVMNLGWGAFAFLVAMIVVIRPISVLVATIGTSLSWKEKVFLAFLAPRGIVAAAVSTVFALEAAKHASAATPLPGVEKIVPLTFLVIVGTVAIYGLAAAPLARALGLAARNPQGILFAGAAAWVRPMIKMLHDEGIPLLVVDTNYRNVSATRMLGVESKCVSVVSEYMEELELGGIGRLLAVTPNDDLNTLAAGEFAPLFGRVNVFQVSPGESVNHRRDVVSPHLRGRYLFAKDATYSQMAFRVTSGAQVKKTKITDEFSFADFQQYYGKNALVLFVITESGMLQISAAEDPLVPKPGQTVLALVDPVDEKEKPEAVAPQIAG